MIDYNRYKIIEGNRVVPEIYSHIKDLTPRQLGTYFSEILEDTLCNLREASLKGISNSECKEILLSDFIDEYKVFEDKKLLSDKEFELNPKFHNSLINKYGREAKYIKIRNIFLLKPGLNLTKSNISRIFRYDFLFSLGNYEGRFGYFDFTGGLDNILFKTSRNDKGIRVSIFKINNIYISTGI